MFPLSIPAFVRWLMKGLSLFVPILNAYRKVCCWSLLLSQLLAKTEPEVNALRLPVKG
jgi:hypothetical protein